MTSILFIFFVSYLSSCTAMQQNNRVEQLTETEEMFIKRMSRVHHGNSTTPLVINQEGEYRGKKLHINEQGSLILSKIPPLSSSAIEEHVPDIILFRSTNDQGWLPSLNAYLNQNKYVEKVPLFALSQDGKWLAYLVMRINEQTKNCEPSHISTITFNRLSQGVVKTYQLTDMVNSAGLYITHINSIEEKNVPPAHRERYESYRATIADMQNKIMNALAISNDGFWVALSNNKTIYVIDMQKEKYHKLAALPYVKDDKTLTTVTALNFNKQCTWVGAAQKQTHQSPTPDTFVRLIMPFTQYQ